MKTSTELPGLTLVTKTCVPSNLCKQTGFGVFTWGFHIACCSTDGCNSASNIAPKIINVALLTFVSLLFKFFSSF